MARRKKNVKAEEAPKEVKATKAKKTEKVATEVVDLDRKLAETETILGAGIQAYMREKIKQATKRG